MPLIKDVLSYFNSQVTDAPPADELFASHVALAFFLVSLIVVEDETDAPPAVDVHTQVRSFLQEAKEAAAATATMNNNFFMF